MLYNCDQEKAVEYLSSVINQVHNFAENLQIIIVELIRKVSKHMPSEKVFFFLFFFYQQKISTQIFNKTK